MQVIGIVAEYNPFHNGHEYLIKKAFEEVGDNRAIVMSVMSGPFTQRGLPAIAPKHIRAKQALLCGVDVVLELPFVFACSPAPVFARGAINTLLETGVITDIAFGVDTSNPEIITRLSELDYENNPIFQEKLKEGLSSGLSFPVSRENAIIALLDSEEIIPLVREVLSSPNSILALEYLTALKKHPRGKKVVVHMIPRQGSYSDANYETTSKFVSASAIRSKIYDNCGPDFTQSSLATNLIGTMPDKSLAAMLGGSPKFTIPMLDIYERDVFDMCRNSEDSLSTYAYMGDGLSGYLSNQASALRRDEKFLESLPTKHFVMPRIYRALSSALIGVKEGFVTTDNARPQYIRVLGFTKDGRYCLKIMRKCSRLPIFTNCSDALELYSSSDRLREMFELDLLANDYQGKLMNLPIGYERELPPINV